MARRVGLEVRLRAARELAWRQYGVLTTEQLVQFDVANRKGRARLVERGQLVVMHPGVYRLADAPQTLRQRWLGALFWRRDGALGLQSASRFWDLLNLPGSQAVLCVTGKPATGAATLVRTSFAQGDVVTQHGFRVTSPERTLLDLAPIVAPEPLMEAVEAAWKRGLIHPMKLLRRIRDLPPQARREVGVLPDLLIDAHGRGAPLESLLEIRFWRLLELYGLPLPEVQVRLCDETGELRVDFLWRDARLVVETQGRRFHLSADGFERSAARSQRLRALGWSMVVVTWLQLEQEPDAVIERLRRALEPTAEPSTEPVIYDAQPVPPHILALFQPDSLPASHMH